jgi:hypothetical protein
VSLLSLSLSLLELLLLSDELDDDPEDVPELLLLLVPELLVSESESESESEEEEEEEEEDGLARVFRFFSLTFSASFLASSFLSWNSWGTSEAGRKPCRRAGF